MFQWQKLGLVIRPTGDPWMRTHAMVPVADPKSDRIRVYFSGRDDKNRSHVSYADLDAQDPTRVLGYAKRPALGLGELGAFDDNGVTPSWLIRDGSRTLLYYIGWNKGSTVRMHLFGGLALGNGRGDAFERHSRAPILERTPHDPLLNTAPCVLREDDRWRMWYVCGTQWVDPDLPRYHMWFSHKGREYRIGYAHSKDGVRWKRDDSKAGIDVSQSGWDSEMICYAYVFPHADRWYMLYNGNQYGRDGIGLAVAKA